MQIAHLEYENMNDGYKAQVCCSYCLSGAHFWQGSVNEAGEQMFTPWFFFIHGRKRCKLELSQEIHLMQGLEIRLYSKLEQRSKISKCSMKKNIKEK